MTMAVCSEFKAGIPYVTEIGEATIYTLIASYEFTYGEIKSIIWLKKQVTPVQQQLVKWWHVQQRTQPSN